MSELQFLDSWTPEKAGRGWDQAVMGGILKVEAGEWCYQAVSIENRALATAFALVVMLLNYVVYRLYVQPGTVSEPEPEIQSKPGSSKQPHSASSSSPSLDYLIAPAQLALDCDARRWSVVSWHSQIMLLLFMIPLSAELMFKTIRGSLIFMLQPCHIISSISIFLLAAPYSRRNHHLSRLNTHLMLCPVQALVFGVDERVDVGLRGKNMHFYWEHVMMLLAPLYLLHTRYPPEPLRCQAYCGLASVFFFVLMWAVLLPISLVSLVNLNMMLCPASADPFSGEYYQFAACVHQTILMYVLGKAFSLLGYTLPRHLGLCQSTDAQPLSLGPKKEKAK